MKILWVEDSEDDVFLFTRAMYRSREKLSFYHVWNGLEAIDYLTGNGPYCDRIEFPLPDVIVTDIKMPVLDGFKFVRWLREYSVFKTIPVLVLSSSGLASDVAAALRLGATDYVNKPGQEPAWEGLYGDIMMKCRHCVPA